MLVGGGSDRSGMAARFVVSVWRIRGYVRKKPSPMRTPTRANHCYGAKSKSLGARASRFIAEGDVITIEGDRHFLVAWTVAGFADPDLFGE